MLGGGCGGPALEAGRLSGPRGTLLRGRAPAGAAQVVLRARGRFDRSARLARAADGTAYFVESYAGKFDVPLRVIARAADGRPLGVFELPADH